VEKRRHALVIAQAQTEGVKVDQDAARELVDALGAT